MPRLAVKPFFHHCLVARAEMSNLLYSNSSGLLKLVSVGSVCERNKKKYDRFHVGFILEPTLGFFRNFLYIQKCSAGCLITINCGFVGQQCSNLCLPLRCSVIWGSRGTFLPLQKQQPSPLTWSHCGTARVGAFNATVCPACLFLTTSCLTSDHYKH